MVFIFFWSDILNTRRSVLSHTLTHRGKISNTGRSVLSDIQTPRSKILNTRGSVSSDIQTLGSDKKKRKGVTHPIPNHWLVTFGTREGVFYLMLHVSSVCTPCCMLLRVVESYCVKFETVQTLSYVQTDATTPNNVGRSWPTMSCPFARGFSMRSGVH